MGPWLFGLINAEVGERRPLYRGRGWAVFALLGIVAVWGWRYYELQEAVVLARSGEYSSAPVVRVLGESLSGDAFRWHVVVETPGRHIRPPRPIPSAGTITTHAPADVYYWPQTTVAVAGGQAELAGRGVSGLVIVAGGDGYGAELRTAALRLRSRTCAFSTMLPLITSRKEAPACGVGSGQCRPSRG